jgi:hypothetical protein
VHGNEAVRASTVDNYQGEEARIILASLVRSNAACRIGWLAEPARVNVLLSRAHDGLILFGNSHCLLQYKGMQSGHEQTVNLGHGAAITLSELKYTLTGSMHDCRSAWGTVLQHMPIVHGFPARCQRHGREVLLQKPSDFAALAPVGGCTEPCNEVLACGHQCHLACHPDCTPHAPCMEPVPCMCAPTSREVPMLCTRPACSTLLCHSMCIQIMQLYKVWQQMHNSSMHSSTCACECRCAQHAHPMTKHCSAMSAPQWREPVPEMCPKAEHVVWRLCGNRVAPPCMYTMYTVLGDAKQGQAHDVAQVLRGTSIVCVLPAGSEAAARHGQAGGGPCQVCHSLSV